MGGMWTPKLKILPNLSPTCMRTKKFVFFFFVRCAFERHGRIFPNAFAMKTLKYRNDFDNIEYYRGRRFVDGTNLYLTLSLCH